MKLRNSQLTARARFGVNLRSARIAHGFSQEELAARSGLHRNYVGSVERNEKNISIDSMERLAVALDLDVVDLLIEVGK
jgi:transcriptional regulator with XRE-family HTH domain